MPTVRAYSSCGGELNIRLLALQLGDVLKYDTSVNEIGRAASALFRFNKESFPHDSITSVRAQHIYDWLMSLGKQSMAPEARDALVTQFCLTIAPEKHKAAVEKILTTAGVAEGAATKESRANFSGRGFHAEVQRHARQLFLQRNYFHAIFEAAKAYNKAVREKAKSSKDGQSLMLEVWGCDRGVLKITACQSETDRNVQDGVKFLSAGLMSAIRNPTSHEPAVDWPIGSEDCLDILSFISFLYRRLDAAVYQKNRDDG